MVPPAEPPARHPAVLLAEHEPQVAELARRYLARAGLRVIMAATPQETIAALCERPAAPAVAVFDLTMPGLDARRLRRLVAPREHAHGRRARRRPSTCSAAACARVTLRASADHCLHRPFSPRFLVARVLSALPSPPPTPAMSLHDRRGFHRRSCGKPTPICQAPANRRPSGPRNRRPPGPGPGSQSPAGSGPADRDITLTPAEFALLSALAAHAGRVLTRDQLQAAMRAGPAPAGRWTCTSPSSARSCRRPAPDPHGARRRLHPGRARRSARAAWTGNMR